MQEREIEVVIKLNGLQAIFMFAAAKAIGHFICQQTALGEEGLEIAARHFQEFNAQDYEELKLKLQHGAEAIIHCVQNELPPQNIVIE